VQRITMASAVLVASCFASAVFAASSPGIKGVVAPGVEPQLVSEAFDNTEGPLGTADGGLLFSDTNASITYRMDPDGKISVFRRNTNRGNGIALTRDGDFIWAEEPRILRRTKNGYTNLTAGFRLFQPNDLIADDKGGIYFTDPGPRPVVPGVKVFVYYIPPGGKPIIIDDSVARPNGITLSRDGKTLIVANTIGNDIIAYDVQPDGSVRNRRVYVTLHDIKPGEESFADGMGIDREGRLYVTTIRGIQVFDARRAYLGTISVPRQPSNVAFGGPDKRTLYISARPAIYKLQMLSQGPERLGK